MIAPRHIERVSEIISLVNQSNLTPILISEVEKICSDNASPKLSFSGEHVFILDSMGKLNSLYELATIVFIPALRGGELSVLYPFISLSYVWVSLLSIKILKEKMNSFKWMGVALIIIGVSFIGFGS